MHLINYRFTSRQCYTQIINTPRGERGCPDLVGRMYVSQVPLHKLFGIHVPSTDLQLLSWCALSVCGSLVYLLTLRRLFVVCVICCHGQLPTSCDPVTYIQQRRLSTRLAFTMNSASLEVLQNLQRMRISNAVLFAVLLLFVNTEG